MKKLLFTLIIMAMAMVQAAAQSRSVATLSHEGEIKAYYGPHALSQAYAAAADGDVITLSSGSFNAVNIGKSLTIRGAGMDADPSVGRQPTYLTGDFYIGADNVTIEGIYSNFEIRNNKTISNLQFIRCRLKSLTLSYSSSYTVRNTQLINCRIDQYFGLYYGSNATCINSIVNSPYNSNSNSNFEFINCYIIYKREISYAVFTNSVIDWQNGNSSNLYSTNICDHCVGFNQSTIFNYVPAMGNVIAQKDEVWDAEAFDFKDASKDKFIGGDGTRVGIYGGMLPFDPTPTNPQITKFNVASRTTADGKLSIDISVAVPQSVAEPQ